MTTSKEYIDTLLPRRSIYVLSKENFPLDDKRVVELVQQVIKYTPTSFNSQTNRAVILFGKNHEKLWGDIAYKALAGVLGEDSETFKGTAAKLKLFENAYGTVLFFEDEDSIKKLQEQFPTYADKFHEFAAHSSGAAHIHTWTALALEGVGANLQHYSPLIDVGVQKSWNVPTSWSLKSQLVFGTPAGEPNDKTFLPSDEVVKYFE